MMRPRFIAGAKMAERVPTTIRASPRRMRLPLLGALVGRKRGVQESYAASKRGVQLRRHGGSEADLRGPAEWPIGRRAGACSMAARYTAVFSRTGHTMQQASTEALSIERGLYMRQCSLLGLVENILLPLVLAATGKDENAAGRSSIVTKPPLYQGFAMWLREDPAGARQEPAGTRPRPASFGKNCQLIVVQFSAAAHRPPALHSAPGGEHPEAQLPFSRSSHFLAQHVGQQLCCGTRSVGATSRSLPAVRRKDS